MQAPRLTVTALFAGLLLAFCVTPSDAQRRPPSGPPAPPARTVEALMPPIQEGEVESIATFEEARSLGVDPNRVLYVTDVRQSTVTAVTPDGRVLVTLGGRGTEAGAFDEPADVDPTNGLEIFVADAGNGRVQHFSRNGKYVEALPIGRVDPGDRTSARQPLFDAGRDGSDARADGRPIAVASTPNGDVFVLDARENAVIRFDRQRRPEPFAGGFDAREGRLVEPVAMALSGQTVFVADAGIGGIVAYDRFGTPEGRIRLDQTPRSLVAGGPSLWAVSPNRILVIDTRRQQVVGQIPVRLDEPIVDAARVDRILALLTPTRLLLVPGRRLPR
jgi:DNA-binding beta-propeller fold protein YncE